MRRFTKRNHRGHCDAARDWDAAGPTPEPGAVVNIVSDAPAVPSVQVVTVVDRFGDIYRLGRNIGAAAAAWNTLRGRWFRFTRFQAQVTATALLYVLLCLAFVLIKAGVHFWTVVK